jgi:hypothetical protein
LIFLSLISRLILIGTTGFFNYPPWW